MHSSFVPECHPYAFVSVGFRLSLCTSTHHHSRSRLLVTLLLTRQASLASALTATLSSVQATTIRYVSGTPKPGQTHTFSRVYVCFHARAHRFKTFIIQVCRKLKVFPLRTYPITLLIVPFYLPSHRQPMPLSQHRGKVHCVTTWKDRIVSASDDGTLYVQTDLGRWPWSNKTERLPCLPSNGKEPPPSWSLLFPSLSLLSLLIPHAPCSPTHPLYARTLIYSHRQSHLERVHLCLRRGPR